MLFRLARGSGAGLAGMSRAMAARCRRPELGPAKPACRGRRRASSERLVRPLLDLPKARLIATLQAAGIAHAEDPSNADPRFARVRCASSCRRWPRRVLPPQRLASWRAACGAAKRRIEARRRLRRSTGSARARQRTAIAFDRQGLRELPAEIALRLLGRAVGTVGDEGPVELGKLEALCRSLAVALDAGAARFRRTLAGAMVSLQRDRIIVERRRRAGSVHGVETLTCELRRQDAGCRCGKGRSRMGRYIRRNRPGPAWQRGHAHLHCGQQVRGARFR